MKTSLTKFLTLGATLGLAAFNANAADQSGAIQSDSTQMQGISKDQMNNAQAQKETEAQERTQDKSQMNAMQFQRASTLNQLSHLNQKEIKLSQMAMEKSQSPQVKEMAKHMLDDHQKAEEKVKQVAKTHNIELTSFQPATHEKAAMENFEKLQGQQFDMAFVNYMRQGHQQATEELKVFSKSNDPQIRNLVKTMLPTIREHQKMAGKLNKSVSKSDMAGQAGS